MPNRYSLAAMLTLIWLGCALTAAADEPFPSLDALLKDYQGFGLPLPPKEAKFVRFEYAAHKSYSLGFEVKPGTKTAHPILLAGTFEWQPYWDPHTQEVKPEPDTLNDFSLGSDDELVLAIQCHARGWDKLAQHLLERSRKEAKLPPWKSLVQEAWYYWKGNITKPKFDLSTISNRLKDLFPLDREFDTQENQALLKSLDLALKPSKAKAGSAEALIDDLVNCKSDDEHSWLYQLDDRYKRVVNLGFDAVPSLIEHLEDDRLTRSEAHEIPITGQPRILRVRDMVSDLLDGLACENIGINLHDPAEKKAEIQKWWDASTR